MKPQLSYRVFDWIGRRAVVVIGVVLLATLTLGVIGPLAADQSEPSFDPAGEIFDVAERAESALQSDSTIAQATFLVEAADGGDVLTGPALTEWSAAAARVANRADWQQHLTDRFDRDLNATVPAVMSIAVVLDSQLEAGLAAATTTEIKIALTEILAPDAPNAPVGYTLSEAATPPSPANDFTWSSPAFLATVTYDQATFADTEAAETWLREVQAEFRREAVVTDVIGVAIDGELAFGEAATQSSPFIFLAVALIVLLIGVVHRSYWSAIVVAVGLGTTMLAYYGLASLLGLKMGSLLLAFVVPIAMISFGVDFYIHGTGRIREMQVEAGHDALRAYPAGMTAVFGAMLLAAASSVAAFVSNAFAGTEAIVEFGLGAALAIAVAYLVLGQLAPRVLLALEGFVGPNPVKRWSVIPYRLGFVMIAVVAGLAVALAAVMPLVGVGAMLLVILGLVVLPMLITRRRNRRAHHRGVALEPGIQGYGHGLRPVGSLVRGLARWRLVTIPLILIVGGVGLFTATNVESGFALTDFLSSNTSFVQSIERTEDHFPSSGQGSGFILVEGDLTNPQALRALDDAVAELDASGADLGRYGDGTLIVSPHAGELVRAATAGGSLPFPITDADGDGYPDTTEQVRAVFDSLVRDGVPGPDGAPAITSQEIGGFLHHGGPASQTTAIVIQIGSFTDEAVIAEARSALERAAAGIEGAVPDVDTGVSGEVITQYESLEAFTDSMLVSLPIAIVLTLLLAMGMLRSFRYALVAVIPIGFVVVGVYAFMAIAGYTVNVVTATIAAIAVGVGIDFSTHFTARYREELARSRDRLQAVASAGNGTGGALVLSAVTSVLGFLVMALAPTPIFATFGLLTAVMVTMSLLVALVVLPSFLVVATPRPRPRVEDAPAADRDPSPMPVPEPARA